MADKNQNPDSTISTEQQPEKAKAQELLEIGELCKQHKISQAVFAGVCSANGWKSGKAISEDEFLKAIDKFKGSSIDGRPGKTKKESEAKK